MKYIKTFENISVEPKIGDYVLVNYNININNLIKKISAFMNSNVGQIERYIKDDRNNIPRFKVKYQNIPEEIKTAFDENNSRIINKEHIIYISSNKEELEAILAANKFNL